VKAETLRGMAFVAGLLMIGYGAWRIYPPAGYITGGLLLVGVAVIGHVRGTHG
jgi:hypothetical protein